MLKSLIRSRKVKVWTWLTSLEYAREHPQKSQLLGDTTNQIDEDDVSLSSNGSTFEIALTLFVDTVNRKCTSTSLEVPKFNIVGGM